MKMYWTAGTAWSRNSRFEPFAGWENPLHKGEDGSVGWWATLRHAVAQLRDRAGLCPSNQLNYGFSGRAATPTELAAARASHAAYCAVRMASW